LTCVVLTVIDVGEARPDRSAGDVDHVDRRCRLRTQPAGLDCTHHAFASVAAAEKSVIHVRFTSSQLPPD
jgi:hypothetical protein